MRVGIDIGGTFTDGVTVNPSTGRVQRAKVSTTTDDPIRGLLEVLGKLGVKAEEAEVFVHGTTLVTNLILQRKGCRVGLLTTTGFTDVLEIQRSYRQHPLNLHWVKEPPLVPREMRLGISERTLADGMIEREPNREEVLRQGRVLVARDAEAIAVALFNSYANPANENQVAAWLRDEFPEMPVSLSSLVDPQIREYERTSTTTVNAYAIPATLSYLRRLEQAVRPDVLLMHSGGGVLPAAAVVERPVKLVQSGPAGGVIATRELANTLGEGNLITFDMGGTSTDVAVLVDGEPEYAAETELTWGIPFRAESLDIRSIGAGGGSIASRDAAGGLRVGPESAGAVPGPVCYRRGGERPTVTDANLVLGLINPERFLGGAMSLDVAAAQTSINALAQEFDVPGDSLAAGIHDVVNANMAQLIREMTVYRGRDPREFALVSFGGAGGQHAAGVARGVGIREVVFPRHSSTFSALGLVAADLETSETQSLLRNLDQEGWSDCERLYVELEHRARRNLCAPADAQLNHRRRAFVRYSGQTHEVPVSVQSGDSASDVYNRFESQHRLLFGTALGDPAELVGLHVITSVRRSSHSHGIHGTPEQPQPIQEIGHRWIALIQSEGAIYEGEFLPLGGHVEGPALVEQVDTTIVVPRGAHLTAAADATSLRLILAPDGL